MLLTLLLDLDDTLLDSNFESFIPAYFQALSKHMAERVSPEVMLPALISGTHFMNQSDDPTRTLREVFEADFYPRLGVPKEELVNTIEQFYDEIFPTLGNLTRPRPDAKPFVDWAFAQGFRIAIATDPLFPRKATYQRLSWAGFDPGQFEVVSTFEDFHFSKTHPAYFAEVLGRMGWPEGPILMVGDNFDRDIAPARKLGLATYHLNGNSALGPGIETEGRGTLADLRSWLESSDLSRFEPVFNTPDANLAILSATPASLAGLSQPLTESEWLYAPAPDDWAVTEIVCHLRDAEREIHHMQIKLFEGQAEPFIPRPDAGVWARQRKYRSENGLFALRGFAAARLETLALLRGIQANDWSRRARHAIFGPTNFLEVVGFMVEHDRLHIQQTWKALQVLQLG